MPSTREYIVGALRQYNIPLDGQMDIISAILFGFLVFYIITPSHSHL